MNQATRDKKVHEIMSLLQKFHGDASSLEEGIKNGDEYWRETCQYERAYALWEYAVAIIEVANRRGG